MMYFSYFVKLRLKETKKLERHYVNITLVKNKETSPLRILKDLIVKVDKLQFPMDFVVMKGGMYDEELFILERSFLVTCNANMNMSKGVLLSPMEMRPHTSKCIMRHKGI